MTYDFADDFCDCICSLSLTYEILGVPSGTWHLQDGTAETWVTVL